LTLLQGVSAVISLFAFWLLLSGHFTPFLLLMGIVSAVAVVLFSWRMAVVDHEGHPIHLGAAAAWYWPWLFKEIVKSAWDVTKLIVHPRLPISPTLIRVRPTQKTDVGLTVYANSITLTPGTIAVTVERDEFLVHALTADGAASLAEGDMDRRATRFEGSK
jgi:multicomponent Na+:H+ antiporter subunit E